MSAFFQLRAADYTESGRYRTGADHALMTVLALRNVRRLLAINAYLTCALLPEVPLHVALVLIGVCLLELLLPAPRYFREPAFQDAAALVCYVTLPLFLVVYYAYGTRNPLLDGLLSFLILYHLKWVFAPRSDFHWLASLLLYALIAIHTNSMLFGVLFATFLFFSLIYLVGAQELGQQSENRDEYLRSLPRRRRIRNRILYWLGPLILVSMATYFVFPRFPPKHGWGSTGKYSGVTDSMELGNPAPLSLDPKIFAYLKLEEGSIPPEDLYLRTGHLDTLLEENWIFYRREHDYGRSPPFEPQPAALPELGRALVFYQAHQPNRAEVDASYIKYRLTVRDPMADFAALPYGTYLVEIPKPGYLRPLGSDFYAFRNIQTPFPMLGEGTYPEPGQVGWPAFPHMAYRPLSPQERRYLSRLPRAAYRRELLALAHYWTRGIRDERLVAAKIANTLRREYRYSLTPTYPRNSTHPIRDFLLVSEYGSGYCEMFAASMVVLLRHLNIPSRVAVGFAGAEYDAESAQYVVRRSNAHAWVEVFVRGEGWIAFDPTPDSVFQSYQNREFFKLAKQWIDWLRHGWSDSVVNFDHVSQAAMFQRLKSFFTRTKAAIEREVASTRRLFAWFSEQLDRHPALRLGFWAFVLLHLAGLVFYILKRWSRTYPPSNSAVSADDFLRRVERQTRTLLGERDRDTTVRSHLAPLQSQAQGQEVTGRVCRYFEELRYGRRPPSATAERQLLASLKRVVHDLRHTGAVVARS